MGRMQRYVADVKADIDREIELEELRKMRDSVQQAATTIETSVQSELNQAETGLNQAAASASGEVSPAQPAAPAIEEKKEAAAAAPLAQEAPPTLAATEEKK